MATQDDDQELLDLLPLYADQTEEVIWSRRIDWANEGRTLDDVDQWTDTREGSFFYVVSIGGAREDARIYDLMGTEVVAAAHPLFAWESYLDAHAEVQNLLRNAAVQAEGEVTFSGVDGVVVPAGTEVGTEPTTPETFAPEYETLAEGTIAGGVVTVPVRALEGGAAYNVSAGAVVGILSSVDAGVHSVVNAAPIIGGSDTESDESLRARLIEVFGGGIGSWNVQQFKVAALAFGNGIGRVTVIPLWDGPTTVKVIVATEAGDPVTAGTVTGLQNFLDPTPGAGEGDVMVGLQVTVETVGVMDVVVSATVELEPGYSLDGAGGTVELGTVLQARVRGYTEAVESGGEIVIAQEEAALVGIKGVHDVGGLQLVIDGGAPTAVNVPVPSDPAKVPSVSAVNLVEGAV